MNYQVFSLAKDFHIQIDENRAPFNLSAEERQEIEDIWCHEQSLKGNRLFNGKLLCHAHLDAHVLEGFFISYKEYIAVLRQPRLRASLPINTLGASGITISDGAILWGKRAGFVTAYPGYWECAPTGGLSPEMLSQERISLARPFELELEEETGIRKEDVLSIIPRAIVFDKSAHLYELVAFIKLKDSLRSVELAASDEYEAFQWIDFSKLPAFFEQHKGEILPMSHYLLTSGLMTSYTHTNYS